MLPTVYEHCRRYYVPTASAIHGLAAVNRRAKANKIAADERFRRCFFHLMMVHRTMLAVNRAVGGFFFRDRQGEEVAGELWGDFFQRSDLFLPYPDRQLVLAAIPHRATFQTFEARLRAGGARGAANRLHKGFRDWEDARFWDTDYHVLELAESSPRLGGP